jgi:hypothetical protein
VGCDRNGKERTPHDGPHAGYQLYDLVLDAAVAFLAEAALVCRGGEADWDGLVLFVLHELRCGRVWLVAALQFLPEGIWLGLGCRGERCGRGHDIPRARKRSSEGMQMALRRRTVTGEGRVSWAAGGGGDRGGFMGGTVL